MKKKLILCTAAAVMLVSAAAQAAYPDDLDYQFISCTLKDGVGYTTDHYYTNLLHQFFDEVTQDGDTLTLRHNGDIMILHKDSTEAEFNGEKMTLSSAPYTYENSDILIIPARAVYEKFGAHVAFHEGAAYPPLRIHWGENIKSVSGMVGDRWNDWSITLPEGFCGYSKSIDTDEVVFDNFDGAMIAIYRLGANDHRKNDEPIDAVLNNNLKLTKVIEGKNGISYLVDAEIYGNGSLYNDMAREIVNSFRAGYDPSAQDLSYLSADGTHWEYDCKALGIAYDMPTKWDTDNEDICIAGYDYGERIHMKGAVYKGGYADNWTDIYNKTVEYYTGEAEHKKAVPFTYKDISGSLVEEFEESSYWVTYTKTLYIPQNGYTYELSFSTAPSPEDYHADEQYFRDELDKAMYGILDTLKLSVPQKEPEEFVYNGKNLPDGTEKVNEVEIGGYKFNIPSHIDYEIETEDTMSGVVIQSPISPISSLVITDISALYEKFEERLVSDESMKDRIGETEINGIKFMTSKKEEENGLIFINEKLMIIGFVDNDTQFGRDLRAIVNSIHE